jgi:hypothetical protein
MLIKAPEIIIIKKVSLKFVFRNFLSRKTLALVVSGSIFTHFVKLIMEMKIAKTEMIIEKTAR